ncbi:pyridine nucleotide-disulfide oxidoreductase-domain-containing protein [Hypoxylon sp. FL1150]|nr:pyridine nucleotide-disulfide oxidoreductase-domain-containing protein [Hypoxylon sp. FL1150]
MSAVTPTNNSPPLPAAERVAAIVVGAGPAGIAVVGNLLELLPPDATVLWVDDRFRGGRINAHYREVPSNTKVKLFLDYAQAVEPFRDIVKSTPKPNSITALQDLNANDTCPLGKAGDMLLTLTSGLSKNPQVKTSHAIVSDVQWVNANSSWNMRVDDEKLGTSASVEAPIVVYCTGSSPTVIPLPASIPQQPSILNLDVALKPSLLEEQVPRDRELCVGVIGASHSAILVLMNLVQLRMNSHPLLSVRWFTRAKNLKYAKDMGDWILYDNTGLKGLAANFAKKHLDGENFTSSHVSGFITRVDCSGGTDRELQAFVQEMPSCDYLVQAVGYTRHPLPGLHQNLRYNHETGGFLEDSTNAPVPGLFGAGIAFPEKVIDPHGNVEYSVGFIKFMRYLKKIVPQWITSTNIS